MPPPVAGIVASLCLALGRLGQAQESIAVVHTHPSRTSSSESDSESDCEAAETRPGPVLGMW